MEKVVGVKSKEFGAFWRCMFMVALCFPNKTDLDNKFHVEKIKNYRIYYGILKKVLPCKFCREYIKDVLEKKFPLNFTGRVALLKSIYIWKKQVSLKLAKQGNKVGPTPSFSEIRKRYEKMYATCDPFKGRCV